MEDSDGNGILSEEEFRNLLMNRMQVVDTIEEVNFLLNHLDPYNNQKMTFSEVVHLLSSHLVPLSGDQPLERVTLLEKFVHRLGVDFSQVELEMQIRDEMQFVS
jgi:Ca2+-binding EF-hand superfamily protein